MTNDVKNEILCAINDTELPEQRKKVAENLINYLKEKLKKDESINLNFICTHNSRRSQFSQFWCQFAANHYGIDLNSYSGGVEVTEFNIRAVKALKRSGINITGNETQNPHYAAVYDERKPALEMFSKLYDDPNNPAENFAAIMTCDHADENCPFIPGADARIPLRYEDPKAFDNTDLEEKMYDERSLQIASEMMYIFSNI